MAIPISYNIRNLKLRKGLTIMTALGIALTVTTAVFLMALLAGLQKAFKSSGDPHERARSCAKARRPNFREASTPTSSRR